MSTRPLVRGIGFPLAAGLLAAGAATAARSVEHPKLVDLESTRCALCHEDLTLDRASIHAPVTEDCTVCHEVEIGDAGTTVSLTGPEPDLCLLCHDELEPAVALDLSAPHFPVADSCLTCHDPHGSALESLLVSPAGEICAECHDLDALAASHDGQIAAETSCSSCHATHGSDNQRMLRASRLHAPFEEGSCNGCHRSPFAGRIRLRARGERLCEACHGNPIDGSDPPTTIHAALTGEHGRAGCLSCHDPHMSDRPSLLLASGPELCLRCHAETVEASRAETGHFAAAEDCLTCHDPHVAAEPHLLIQPDTELCAECHERDDPDLGAAHLGADLSRLDCVACHTPHGAGNAKLLAENVHAPVEDGCDICHESTYDQLLEGGGSELCVFCHDDVQAAVADAAVPHAALEVGSCTDCHNPHASRQEKLVKAPGAGPCGECHDEQSAAADEVQHGVVELLGCRACHEPHGGNSAKLLIRSGAELCLACHGSHLIGIAERLEYVQLLDRFEVATEDLRGLALLKLSANGEEGHPLQGHRVLGLPTKEELRRAETTHEGELTCLTCHDPHKGRSTHLFRWQASGPMEACQACHPK